MRDGFEEAAWGGGVDGDAECDVGRPEDVTGEICRPDDWGLK